MPGHMGIAEIPMCGAMRSFWKDTNIATDMILNIKYKY